MRRLPHLVGAEWSSSGPTATVENPAAPGETVAVVSDLGAESAAQAVTAARDAAPAWGATTAAQRAAMLHAAAALVEARATELAADLTAENGKPLSESRGEIAKTAATFRYYAGLAGALDGRAWAGEPTGTRHETRLEPIGPVVAITPWNVPAAGPARKLAGALLAGDPIILKPAELTPITAISLVRSLCDAGVPAGVVQVLPGRGPAIGAALVSHPDIAAVSFTGSTATGMSVARAVATPFTRVQLELGGKNAAVVLPDADLDRACHAIVTAAFASAGQQCTATSRVIVHRAVAAELTDRLVRRTKALVVGDPRDPSTDIGPLVSSERLAAVSAIVDRAVADGATCLAGGSPIDRSGWFYAPTVLADVPAGSEIATAEVFGPVIGVEVARDLDHAVSLLNSTSYGLSCAVHTADLRAAHRVAAAAECGVVGVNRPTAGIELAAPFGGFGQSGTDSKEHGPESLRFFTRVKTVTWAIG